MSFSARFEGSIIADGVVRSDGVDVWMSDNDFALGEVPPSGLCRLNIFLIPFTRSMLLTQDPDRMRQGLFFEVRGNRVGSFSEGPLGHPGDGEFNCRDIVDFRARTTYHADRVEVEIEGRTGSGIDVYDANKILQPGRFSVQFTMPKGRVAEFFKLPENARAVLMDAFSRAFPA